MKKYAYFMILSLVCCACSGRLSQLAPNHMGITPSCEWELKEGSKPIHKPKISTTLDWNF